MERTGHRSLDGVRTYKRPCEEQHKELSDVLHGGDKKVKIEQNENSIQEVNVMPGNKTSYTVTPKPDLHFSGCNGIHYQLQFLRVSLRDCCI